MEYILNKNAQMGSGSHKIHTDKCSRKPKEENIIYLGKCMCPLEAKSIAQRYYANISECKYCWKDFY